MQAEQYYDSLIQQGYTPQDAERFTSQHYPGFTTQPKMAPPIQDSVVGGDVHSGDVIHHHHAAPVVQVAPQEQSNLWAPAQNPAQPVYVVEEKKKKIFIAPWIGIGLIVFMMLMPFVQVSIEGEDIGDSMSGFEIIGEMSEAAGESDGGDGGDDEFDLSDIPEEWVFFGIAIIMLMFSPVVYLLFALISTGLLAFKKHTLVIGILHLLFFSVFFACSIIGTIDFEGFTISAHGNMAGWGFFGAGLAGILLCIRA